ncbi:DUF7009 family protein [Parapedobacter indicus]|uniref:Uncharacterized protein n=1 Tax=Parapedobacter indicus TaxID=1477437 RepID=A0A1I3RUZ0_9SPHI|nr:hypothetical protein [Parapedobacter indicus]PPK99962.1 hypothetical protein CLV26_11092 [Parapedobacter indicus]SFJ50383.1 hypothetical protein SAMN05444682_110153 [Parapedobacter indicus]
MKIRIKGNSLRYRLTRSEVAGLKAAGRLEEHTAFDGKTFTYAIETGNSDRLTADFIENKIVLNMPRTMIDELYNTDKVGFEDTSGTVSLLVEKDFACIDNTEEDQSDHYPNPSLSCD